MKSILTFATADSSPVSSVDVSAALHSMMENPFLQGRQATAIEERAFLQLCDNVFYDELFVGDIVFMCNEDDNIAMIGYVTNSTDATPDEGVFYKMIEGDDDEPDVCHNADTKVFVIARKQNDKTCE